MTVLRVGVIGLGVGQQHAIGYDQNPHCRVVGLCDRKDEVLEAVRQQIPDVCITHSSDELIDDPNIDLLSIASNDDDHFDQVCRALDCGKHVFIEKPMCQSLDQLRKIKQKWSRTNGRLKLKSNT